MAVKGYFYNAHLQESGVYDRLYNDEDFCRFMHNVIGNGVFPTPSTQLAVELTSGMGIKVRAGDSWIEGHKVQNTEDYALTIDASDPIFSRIDRVVIFTDSSDSVRAGGIRVIKGTPAANPVAPKLTRHSSEEGKYIADPNVFELCLAEITIQPNATALTLADLKDTRPDSDICGWVAGLIQQVDTATLYRQWAALYKGLYSDMETWQEQMKTQFDTWFYRLSSQLTVGAYIRSFHKVVEGGGMVSNVIPLDMEGYEYEVNDIFIANLNGLMLTKDKDYSFAINAGVPTITLDGNMDAGELFEITILKTSLNQTAEGLITNSKGDKIIYINDAMPNRNATGMLINNLGEDNEIVVTNRNLIDFSQIPASQTVNGLTFTNDRENGITINGTTGSGGAFIEIPLDPEVLNNMFFNDYTCPYIILTTGKTSGNTSLILTLEHELGDEDITATNSPEVYGDPASEIVSATIRIGAGGSGTVVSNEVIKPMIAFEMDETPTLDYVPGTRSSFTYTEDSKPILTDSVNYVYSTDPNVSEMAIYYVMLGSDANGDSILYPLNS